MYKYNIIIALFTIILHSTYCIASPTPISSVTTATPTPLSQDTNTKSNNPITNPETESKNDQNDIDIYPDDDYLKKEDEKDQNERQKIIQDYKKYLSGIKGPVIQEIRNYRKAIAKINKEKKALFQGLSQEAQKYLAKEAEVKRKLPINNIGGF